MIRDNYLGACCPVCNVPWAAHPTHRNVAPPACEMYRPPEAAFSMLSYQIDHDETNLARERHRARMGVAEEGGRR